MWSHCIFPNCSATDDCSVVTTFWNSLHPKTTRTCNKINTVYDLDFWSQCAEPSPISSIFSLYQSLPLRGELSVTGYVGSLSLTHSHSHTHTPTPTPWLTRSPSFSLLLCLSPSVFTSHCSRMLQQRETGSLGCHHRKWTEQRDFEGLGLGGGKEREEKEEQEEKKLQIILEHKWITGACLKEKRWISNPPTSSALHHAPVRPLLPFRHCLLVRNPSERRLGSTSTSSFSFSPQCAMDRHLSVFHCSRRRLTLTPCYICWRLWFRV